MTERLVMTVGGSPTPLLATLLALRPSELAAIVSEESGEVLARVLDVLAEFTGEPRLQPRILRADPFDLPTLDRVCSQALVDGAADVAYAGGTAAMSGALLRQYLAQPSPGTAAWFVANDGDVITSHLGETRQVTAMLNGRDLTLEQVLRMHGALPDGASPVKPVEVRSTPQDLYRRLLSMPERVPSLEADQANRELLAIVAESIALLLSLGSDPATVYPSAQVVVRGRLGWMTEPLPLSVVQGLRLTVVDVKGYAKDSKNWWTRRHRTYAIKESMYRAAYLSERAGGYRARAAVLSTDPHGETAVARLRSDTGPDTSPDYIRSGSGQRLDAPRQISAFSLRDLEASLAAAALAPDLRGTLSNWLEGAVS